MLSHPLRVRSACHACRSAKFSKKNFLWPGFVRDDFCARPRPRCGEPRRPGAKCVQPSHENEKPADTQRAFVKLCQIERKSGAGEGIRTLDPDLGKVVLYH